MQDVPDENAIDGDGEGLARADDFDLASFFLSVELDKGLWFARSVWFNLLISSKGYVT